MFLLKAISYSLLSALLFPSSPTVMGFATVFTFFELTTCDVISGFLSNECWDWTPISQHQTPACALRCNNMTCLYWHGLHTKMTSMTRHFGMSYSSLLYICIFFKENSDVVYGLKKYPQGAKDTKDSNLTILPCYVNIFCPREVPGSK